MFRSTFRTSFRAAFRAFLFCLLVAAMSGVSPAQSFVLDLPLQSQEARISQRIGITDITITYHRPLVGDRKVWGALVPYGKVWRAGANMNTTITFSDPVQIEGKPLDKGTYGLHMIPNADEWTIIFSQNSTSWGSFTYDEKEDALRVTVKPKAADMHNALTYDFDDLQKDSVVVELEWEKIAVPFKVSVDVHDVVQASLKKQLRNLSQYTWRRWDWPGRKNSINTPGSCWVKSATRKRMRSSAKMPRSIPICGWCMPDWLGCIARRASSTMRQRK